MSDGTSTATVMVKDLQVGGNTSYPRALVERSGLLYFLAVDTTASQNGLWRTSGTAASTAFIAAIPDSSPYPTTLIT